MKNLIVLGFLVILLFATTGCGALNESCGSDIRMGCNAIFGYDSDYYKDKARQYDEETKKELDKRLATFEMEMGDLESSIIQLGNDLDNFEHDLDQVEINVTDALNRLSQLEGETRVVEIVKPCPNAREVLIKLSDNRVVAYFEQGNRRYLSFLADGNYRTTDGANCNFTIPLQ